MKNRIIITSVFLLLIQCVFANEIISHTIYSNGAVVSMCKSGSNIDYCTEQDRQNEIAVIGNKNIFVVEKRIFNQQKNNNFNEQCFNVSQKVGATTNVINSFANTARMVTSYMGINW